MQQAPDNSISLSTTKRPLAGVRGYGLAVLLVGLAWAGRTSLNPVWGDQFPYLLFFVAMFVMVQVAETGPVLLTIGAGLVLGDWFFVAPRHSLLIAERADLANTAIYLFLGGVFLSFALRTRRAQERERAAQEELRHHMEALRLSRARFEHLFEHSPVATWVEDWTALAQWLAELRRQGVTDLAAFLQDQPEQARHAAALIRVWDVNQAAVRQSGAKTKGELMRGLSELFTDGTYQNFLKELNALWQGQCHIEQETCYRRLDGERQDVIISIDIPQLGGPQHGDFANVIVTTTDISARKKAEQEREGLVRQLQEALAAIRTLNGLLPICAHCKRIRDDAGYWNQIELYILQHSNASFTHGICPECSRKLYPELFKEPQASP